MAVRTPVRAALLIGCEWYGDPKLRRLRAPMSDIQALKRLLLDPDVGRFDTVELVPSGSRGSDRADIVAAIERFFARRISEDFLLLYFGGHGIQGATGELIFCARDTFLATRNATGIPASWVGDRLRESASRRVLVLLDCCFSGAFPADLSPRSDVEVRPLARAEGKGRLVMTASTALEYAFEDDRLVQERPTRSVFTHAVLTGIETGAADRDADGRVSVNDLYLYVHDEVRACSTQTPTLRGEQEGPLYISFRSNLPGVDTTGGLDLRQVPSPPAQRPSSHLEIVRTRVVRVPRIGDGGGSAKVARLLCAAGQRVSATTPLIELTWETRAELRTLRVLARFEGVLRGLTVAEGERITADSPLGVVAIGVSPNGAAPSTQPRMAPREGIVRPVTVMLPQLEQPDPATVLAWWALPGDRVAAGEPLLQVDIGGKKVDVTSNVTGLVQVHALLVGETARGGEVVAVVSVD